MPTDTVRKLHLLIGLFFMPTILFFAITGVLQTFQLHEAHDDYVPPPVVTVAAQLHKEQTFNAKALMAPPEKAPHKHDSQPLVPLKWFALFAATGLVASQITGLMLALRYKREAKAMAIAFFSGLVIPILIAALQ